MRVLVTGAGGFVGAHLTQHLLATGAEVCGLGQRVEGAVQIACDINDLDAVKAAVNDFRPEGLVHLAGLSSVAECNKAPMTAFEVNARGTLSVLLAVQQAAPKCRVLVVSSGEVYGAAAGQAPVDESVEPKPVNIYGASKRAAEVVALQLAHSGMQVMIARAFNHIGKGQSPSFVLPSFAQQLARGPVNQRAVLEVGNLSAVRDFTHVVDVVEAYALLLDRGVSGQIYNVGSSTGHSIEQMLQMLVRLSGRQADVRVDPSRLRPVEIPYLVAGTAKLKALGWQPRRSLEQALVDIIAEHSEQPQQAQWP